jgi:hypothetical protein
MSPGGKGVGQQRDPFLENYGLKSQGFVNTFTPLFGSILGTGLIGNKNSYTPSGSNYIDPYSQPFRQSPIADPYAGAFQPFTGSYGYQQPMYSPPQQFYSPPQQYYPPPQQYFSPYMNQFQMAGGQFYQQPYSYQPSPYYQQGPFMQPTGRTQFFANQNMGGKGGYY